MSYTKRSIPNRFSLLLLTSRDLYRSYDKKRLREHVSKIIVTFGNMILPRVGYHVPKIIATFCEIVNKKKFLKSTTMDVMLFFLQNLRTFLSEIPV